MRGTFPPSSARSTPMRPVALLCATLLTAIGCGDRADPPVQLASAVPGPSASAPATTASSAAAPRTPARAALAQREGQAIVRAPNEPALYLADEDHSALRRV